MQLLYKPIAYCLLPIAYCLLPIAHCPLPIAHCLLPIAILPIACLSRQMPPEMDADLHELVFVLCLLGFRPFKSYLIGE